MRTLRYVVLDTELTSLDARSNRVLSIGAIAMEGTRILLGEEFYRVVNPGVEIPRETVLVHGLRPTDVEGGEAMGAALADLKQFARGAVLVGHFVAIDRKALEKELGADKNGLVNPAVDTAKIHRWLLKRGRYSEDLGDRYEKVDLATLAQEYKLPVQEPHHALADAFLTAQLWQKLIICLEREGVTTLGALLRIG